MEPSVSVSLDQFRLAWNRMALAVPGNTREQSAEADLIFSGLPIPFFNVGIMLGEYASTQSLRSAAGDAAAWASKFNLPWFLILTRERVKDGVDADAILDELEMVPMLNLAGMLAEELQPPKSKPDNLTVSRAEEDDSCASLLAVNGAAYGMDLSSASDVLGTYAFWKPHVAVVGKRDGQPVACSAVMSVDGYHYVAFVATHPDHQRRGYADAAMRHSLELAEREFGKRPSFLHATDAGKPVYERMGYTVVSNHMLYIEKKYLGDQ